ncbi:myb-related protein MYBAS1 isoform X2 [Brachypodium distachyon]|uniref:Uncharacterized protein n=1 Tax=Brachypodium distachyon TaxID=15368 RepID=I1IJ63_BRADI|nr:myb-related protein MYBAS1 isoform X2 [Brachypodium distachyon]KQJ87159.1 hypothetical protein BRADI_4g09490v3 [Brachypodium distachyon]|eukprot:XP_003577218.1 myb-related protein MYBAS1 isoform X2 [Brachypodium distachyon]
MDRAGGPATGLNRTGKSCRLRWVNYLHPGLKHGRMSPQEEHLIIELHARWGNRWSRIAGRLPGRTDNEIKNYWRTHMRKKAQERTTDMSPSSSCSSFTYQSGLIQIAPITGKEEGSASNGSTSISSVLKSNQSVMDGYSMDQIWREIEAPAMLPIDDKACGNLACPLLPSPVGDCYYSEVVWKMDDYDTKILAPEIGYVTGGGSCY